MINKIIFSRLIDLYRLSVKAERDDDGSFASEYEVLNNIAITLNIENGFVVDIAASDGYTQSCTLGFFRKQNWSGLAVEMDPIKFSKLAFLYSNFPNAKLAKNRVTPLNIKSLLDSYEIPNNISILNLDIDSYDLYVIEEMLKTNYKPEIISMEINEKIPTGIFFTVDYDDTHFWQGDHFYGCSLDAASSIVKPFGYILHSLAYNNAIFIRTDSANNHFPDLTPEEAYNIGYRNKPDRKQLFPWNANVEKWLSNTPDENVILINEFFKNYEENTLYV